jgi:AraC-like DNA-binding protein
MKPQYELIESEDSRIFHCAHFICSSLSLEHGWHCHPEVELTYILNSAGTRFVGDCVEPYQPGDLVLVGSGLPHCWVDSVGGEKARTPPELIVLQFTPTTLNPLYQNAEDLAGLRSLMKRAALGLAFSPGVSASCAPIIKQLSQARGVKRVALFFELFSLLCEAPARTLAAADYNARPARDKVSRERMETIHTLVRTSFDSPLEQRHVAESVGLSPAQFSRFFREMTGTTFMRFVASFRVHRACELLRTTELQITQIAMDCGFQNVSHFNRTFKGLHAMSPSEYRSTSKLLESAR